LPGMQAAFVDIGLERNAFLYVDDVYQETGTEESRSNRKKSSIEEILKVGEKILVQVVKEPFGSKGARVTCQITLPGRYLVLMPTVDYIGVSRRIERAEERQRLKSLAESIKGVEMGLIVRTVAENKGLESLKHDVDYLTKMWKRIQQRINFKEAPALVHQDLNLIYRIVRDLFTDDIDQFLIDTKYEYDKVLEILDYVSPSLKNKIFYYRGEKPIFDKYNLENEIEKALRHTAWLDCGGYLVFDQMEALTVVDVNTGKYIGSTNLEDTVFKTNMEAAKEIPRQLRLRDIGGIIIIDFIDMNNEEHQKEVLHILEENLKKDRTKAHILGITNLGLVEMTRKKVRQGLDAVLMQSCPYCDGKGKVLSVEVMSSKIERLLKKILTTEEGEAILLEVNQSVAALLIGSNGINLKKLEEETNKAIFIRGSDSMHIEKYKILMIGEEREVSRLASPVNLGQVYRVKIEEPHLTNPYDGIARVQGFIIDVQAGGAYVGKDVEIEITEVAKTFAKAKLLNH
ncbi:MAG: ribonuclease G, partial [Firmicutes bacterium HGW-Firmicutes-13]